jgi:hypothetical protein
MAITKDELIAAILENIDLSFVDKEDETPEDEELDEEELEEPEEEDSPELSEEDIERMPVSTILDSIDSDVFISLINAELGDGVLSGILKIADGKLTTSLSYFDDSREEEEDVFLNESKEVNADDVENVEDFLRFLNEVLDALTENLESDEGMEFF